MEAVGVVIALIVGVCISILICCILVEVLRWMFRINRALELLEQIEKNTKHQKFILTKQSATSMETEEPKAEHAPKMPVPTNWGLG